MLVKRYLKLKDGSTKMSITGKLHHLVKGNGLTLTNAGGK